MSQNNDGPLAVLGAMLAISLLPFYLAYVLIFGEPETNYVPVNDAAAILDARRAARDAQTPTTVRP